VLLSPLGVRLLFSGFGFSLSGQNQLTPSYLLHTEIYVTIKDYCGIAATFYDMLTRRDESDIAFYLNRIPAGSRVLEFGAGTGRIALPLCLAGINLTAVDDSEDMLQQLRAKVSRESLEGTGLRIINADVRKISIEEKYHTVLLGNDLVSHFISSTELGAVFDQSFQVLYTGGSLFVDLRLFHEAFREAVGGIHFSSVPNPASNWKIYQYVDYDPSNAIVYREYMYVNAEAIYITETHTEKFWDIDVLCSALRATGFSSVKIIVNYDRIQTPEDSNGLWMQLIATK
jgi:ubiquinone/menaquinone biosynthesis C-methylase UbiE